jgi:hypothetical protein
MFSYLNFIRLLKSLSRLTNTQQGYSMKNVPFPPKSDAVWDKFCTQIRIVIQAKKIKYENIKLNKKKEYEVEHA